MAICEGVFYWITCDDCSKTLETPDETLIFQEHALYEANRHDWLITDDGHWCPDCREKHEPDEEDE